MRSLRPQFVPLAGQKNEAGQIPERLDKGNDLGGQAAARASDGLILTPPFAPVPCWWTRTMVPSMIAYSKSGSPERLWKMASKTPFTAHLRKDRVPVAKFLMQIAPRRSGAGN